MFTQSEQAAIKEKLKQLKKVKTGHLSEKELADLITQRRISWLKENKDIPLSKYSELPDEEKAYRIIFFDHMKINPKHSKILRINKRKIKIESANFCPYLEARKKLNLDTKYVCKKIGEPSVQQMCRIINSDLRFRRNYKKIRPHHSDFCEEYLELKK